MAKFASRLPWGQEATDWDERINFARMRQARLVKTKLALHEKGVAACVLARPENVRYVTGTKSVEFIDHLRYCVAFAEHDPILYEMGGRTIGNCPWIKPENIKLAIHWANGSCGLDGTREGARKFAQSIKQDLAERGLAKEKIGVDLLDEPAY
jgi:Xaa-Pro aminopeptidase